MPTNSPGKPRQACRRAGGSHLNITCALLEMPKLFKLPGRISQIGLPLCLSPQCEEGNSEGGGQGPAQGDSHSDQWWLAGQGRNLGGSCVGTDFPSSSLLPPLLPFLCQRRGGSAFSGPWWRVRHFCPQISNLPGIWDLGVWGSMGESQWKK